MPMQKRFNVPSTVKTWLVAHWRLQLLALGGVGVVALAGIWMPYYALHQTVKHGLTSASLGYRQSTNMVNALSNLDSPTAIQAGVYDSAGRYARAVKAQRDSNQYAKVSRTKHIFALWFYPSSTIKLALKQANILTSTTTPHIATLNATLPPASDQLDYHARVSRALVNVLEYNPAIDFSTYAPGSADTNTRLDKAKTGIAKAQADLNAISIKNISDPGLAEINTQLGYLENSRKEFATTGDLAIWVSRVSQTQRLIIENRANYWRRASEQYRTKLIPPRDHLKDATETWRRIGANIGYTAL